jgi:hypothetical protein
MLFAEHIAHFSNPCRRVVNEGAERKDAAQKVSVVIPRPLACPGKNFPLDRFIKDLS